MWRAYSKVTWSLIYLTVFLTALYLIIPTLVVVPMSFSSEQYLTFPPVGYSLRWYEKLLDMAGYTESFKNSMKVGIVSSLLATILGTCAALALVRGKMPFSRPLSALVLAPLMLPQIILAIGLLPVLAAGNMYGGYAGIIIAHTAIGMPLVVITVSASLRNYDPSYELASMTLGANWRQTFRYVTFPTILPGILIGALFAFATSFDEVIIALFLTDGYSTTLPKFMFGEMRYQLNPTIAAASTVVVLISLAILATAAAMQRMSSTKTAKED